MERALPRSNADSPFRKMNTSSKGFQKVWQFANCHGVIDGKHINNEATTITDTPYFNYQNIFSVVLMEIVDASYKFILEDIGAYGCQADANVFARSTFN